MTSEDNGPDKELTFAANMRKRREALGITQEELARKVTTGGASIHQQTVNKIEAGTRRVKITEGALIAKALGTTVEEMLSVTKEGMSVERLASLTGNHRAALTKVEASGFAWKNAHDELRAVVEEIEQQGITAEGRVNRSQLTLGHRMRIAVEELESSPVGALRAGVFAALLVDDGNPTDAKLDEFHRDVDVTRLARAEAAYGMEPDGDDDA